MGLFPKCINNRCGDTIHRNFWIPLCPSCRYVGKWGMAIGGLLAGMLMKVFL